MLVFVTTLASKTISIDIEGSDTVAFLKHKVLALKSILPEHQQLIFAGKTLSGGRTLDHYKIKNGSTIFLVFRVLGGGACTGYGGPNIDGGTLHAQYK